MVDRTPRGPFASIGHVVEAAKGFTGGPVWASVWAPLAIYTIFIAYRCGLDTPYMALVPRLSGLAEGVDGGLPVDYCH